MNSRKKRIPKIQTERIHSVKFYEQKVDSFPSTPESFHKTGRNESKFSDLQIHLKKNQMIRDLLKKDKERILPNLKNTWQNSRDVSHLRDTRQDSNSQQVFNLPTDLHALKHGSVSATATIKRGFTCTLPILTEEDPGSIDKILLGNPSGRQEIENLAKWLAIMKDKYITTEINSNEDSFENANLIYKVCLKEIIRQVAVHCQERGKLLKEIVDATQTLTRDRYDQETEYLQQQVQMLNTDLKQLQVQHKESQESNNNIIKALQDKNQAISIENELHRSDIRSLELNLEGQKMHYEELRDKFDKKTNALRILVNSLTKNDMELTPRMTQYIKGSDLPTEGSANQLKPFDLHGDTFSFHASEKTEIIRCNLVSIDREVQTEQESFKLRYIFDWTPRTALDHSFGADQHWDKIHEQYKSTEEIKNMSKSFIEVPHLKSMPNLTPEEFFQKFEDELLDKFEPHLDFDSWKSGVIAGIEKCMNFHPNDDDSSHSRSKEFKRSLTTNFFNDDNGEMNEDLFQEEELAEEDEDSKPPVPYMRSKTSKPEARSKTKGNFILKSIKQTTKFKEFQWHRKKESSVQNKKMSDGVLVLQNLCRTSLEKMIQKGTMSPRMLNRVISNVYLTCIAKNKLNDIQLLVDIIYDEISHRYGLKRVADRKFGELVCSLFRFRKGKRKMFLKFIGVGQKLGSNNYSKYSLKLFLSMYYFMLNAKVGINVHTDEHSDVIKLPAVRASECLKEKAEPFLDKIEVTRLQTWIERNSIPDNKKINQSGLINMDKFLLHVIEAYEIYQLTIYEGLFAMFQALMLEGNQINSIELEMLARFTKSKKFIAFTKAEDLEGENSQLEKYSFEQLFELCIEKNLLGINDVLKTVRENNNIADEIHEQKEELVEILEKMQEQHQPKWRTLTPQLIQQRLQLIENSIDEIKTSLISLGWNLYTAELQRIKEQFLSDY